MSTPTEEKSATTKTNVLVKKERYGDRTEEMRKALDSDGGWAGILRGYAERASNATA